MPGSPLADRIRPTSLDEVVGQEHLLAPGKLFRTIVESGHIPNLIFYGPSGTGKTTLAEIIAARTGKRFYRLNATTASTADIKEIIAQTHSLLTPAGILLYLDEIQYFNKKQQQSLLEFIEKGSITLIAATTENPYFYVYNAILSRSTIFEFYPVEKEPVKKAVRRGIKVLGQETGFAYRIDEQALDQMAAGCGGDVRKAINALELLSFAIKPDEKGVCTITAELVRQAAQRSAMRYDKTDDSHYDIMSALQKSIRGSDENAALHYLGRLLEAGDLPSACRRILVTASEDIGLAYPQAVSIVKACIDAALQLGLPEARIPLAEAVILLATAPKSNSAAAAIDAAMADIRRGGYGDIPAHLKDAHYAGAKKLGRGAYIYPHPYPYHWVAQQYLPDEIKNAVYYEYGDNRTEQAGKKYWQQVKNKKKG